MNKINFLPPWVETNLQPAFYDLESGTVLQQTARMYAKVNQLIRVANEQNETIADYVQQFTDLHDYVYDYFDNLDVQEEVNHKIDEMVEDGTLESILENYTDLQKQYDTLDEAIADESLVNGSCIKCYGKDTKNDGNGGEFKVTDSATDIQLDNGLYLEKINNYQNNYYNIIPVKERYYNTDCYITTIPLNDEFDNQIDLHLSKKEYSGQNPTKYAQDHHTNITINAGLTWTTDLGVDEYPFMIGDGVVLSNNDLREDSHIQDEYTYLCFSADRTITTYPVKTTSLETLQAGEYTQVFDCYYPIIEESQVVDFSAFGSVCKDIATKLHPRQVLGIKADKTIIIMTTEGRTGRNIGLTSQQCADILLGKGCVNAWNLDGGGSTNLTFRGTKLNGDIDNDFTSIRNIAYSFNLNSKNINNNIAQAFDNNGYLKQNFTEYLLPLIPFVRYQASVDCDVISTETKIVYSNNFTNSPYNEGGWLISLPNTATAENRSIYGTQIFIPRNRHGIYKRYMWNGSWQSWTKYQSLINTSNPSAHTISTTNVFEIVPLGSINTYSGDTAITKNDDDTFSINYNDGGALKLIIQGRIEPQSTSLKTIKIKKNGSDVRSYQVTGITDKQSFTLIAPVVVGSNADKFNIEVYGTAGDKFSQLQLTLTS